MSDEQVILNREGIDGLLRAQWSSDDFRERTESMARRMMDATEIIEGWELELVLRVAASGEGA